MDASPISPDPADALPTEPAKLSLAEQLRVARREMRAHELLVSPWRRRAQALDLQEMLTLTKRHEDAQKARARAEEAGEELRRLGFDPFTGERLAP